MGGGWSFYGRRDELGCLLEHMRRRRWFFGTVRGRRRIGKTALIQQALATLGEDEPDSAPWLLVQLPDSNPLDSATVFRNAVREARLEARLEGLDAITDLPGVADAVGLLCRAGVTVVLDEFQVCRRGPLSGFPSLLQAQVDRLQDRYPVGGLLLLGSVQTEMEALLDDRQAPLFGRKTFDIALQPWELSTVFEVAENHGAGGPARCLTLWTLFGGVPKYWRHFAEAGDLRAIPDWSDWAQQVCERLFLRADSPLREEGESLLGRELRRNYVAILRALADRGPCAHADLQNALPPGLSLGPYLTTLTADLRLIEKQYPVFADTRQRRVRYAVSDPFLCAWLSVIGPACQAARIQPAARVAERLVARLSTLEGHAFERMVRVAAEEVSRAGGFTITDRVRGYWNRPRTGAASVEIDFVAWNEDDRVVRFGSCKRSSTQHDSRSLRAFDDHVARFVASAGRRFATWRRELVLFSPEFASERRACLEADGWTCLDLLDFHRLLRDGKRGAKGVLPASPKVEGRG